MLEGMAGSWALAATGEKAAAVAGTDTHSADAVPRIAQPYVLIATFGWPDAASLLRYMARSRPDLPLVILTEQGCGFWKRQKWLEEQYYTNGGKGALIWFEVAIPKLRIDEKKELFKGSSCREESEILLKSIPFSEWAMGAASLWGQLNEMSGGARPEIAFLADIASVSGAVVLSVTEAQRNIVIHAHSAYPLAWPLSWPLQTMESGKVLLWHPACRRFPEWKELPDVGFRSPGWMRPSARLGLLQFFRRLGNGRRKGKMRIGIILTTGHEIMASDVHLSRLLERLAALMREGAGHGATFHVRMRAAEDYPAALKAMCRHSWPEEAVTWKRIGEESFSRFASSVDIVVEVGDHSSASLLAIAHGLPVLSMVDAAETRRMKLLRSIPRLSIRNAWRAIIRLAGTPDRRRRLRRRQAKEYRWQAVDRTAVFP